MKLGRLPVEQGMQLDRCLGGAEWRPRKQHQAQIDGRGIQCVDGFLQIHAEGLVGVEPTGDSDQMLRELRIDSPVARFVGIGEHARMARAYLARNSLIWIKSRTRTDCWRRVVGII